MPSENNSTFADLYPKEASAASSMRSDRLSSGLQAGRNAYNNVPAEHQKALQNKLHQMQNTAPILGAEAAKSLVKGRPTLGLVKSALSIMGHIDWSKDWLFILLASFALLKDIFDFVLMGLMAPTNTLLSAVPWLGPLLAGGATAMGETVTFVFEILLLCLTATVLALVGSSWKNRGVAKYFIGIAIAFISEAFPGISLLPLAFLEVIVLFGFVLFDRAAAAQGAGKTQAEGEIPEVAPAENPQIPAYATADNYEKRMAA